MHIVEPVLITGASGYLGSFLTRRLRFLSIPFRAFDVIPSDGVQTKNISELTTKDMKGISAIIHLAAVVGTAACEKDPERAKKTNVESTIHLCKLAGKTPIYFTNTNIGYPPGYSDEKSEMESKNVYGQTKIEAERIILDHGGISLRLASVFGLSPRMRHDLLVHFLVRECVKRKPVKVFELDASRNFVSIKDVIHLFLHRKGLRYGHAYNVALRNHYTKRELIKIIESAIGKVELIETNEKDPDARDQNLSTEKLTLHTGYSPKHTLQEEIPGLVKHYVTPEM